MPERKESHQIFPNLAIVIIVALVAVIAVGCSKGFSPSGEEQTSLVSSVTSPYNPSNEMVQSNNGGAVTIDMEWRGQENGSLVFYVTMNTHSVDLDRYDLRELAVLRDNEGNEYSPTSWDSSPGGHHVRGMLSFTLPDSLEQGETEYIEIIIRDVDGIEERFLKWEL